MTVQLAASLERMTHTQRTVYISVGVFHLKALENTVLSLTILYLTL